MKNILITGGAGYIGSHVTNLLIDNNYNVSVVDNLITGNVKLINKKASFHKCDISDTKKIKKIITKNQFDIVMHFAGLIRVDESIKNPKKYYEFNYKKAKIFFNTCFKYGLKKIIFSSTAAVYGNPKVLKVSEKNKLNPLNPYAKTKLRLENFLKKKSISDNISFVILRYFNVAGADRHLRSGLISNHSTHLIKIAAEVATNKKKELIINGNDYDTKDGTPVRDYIHVSDLANIHLITAKYLFKKKRSNIFNCGYGVGFSVKEVINAFNKILSKKIKFKIGPRREGDSKYIVADSSKFKKIFKWKPKYNNLKYILKTAYDWEKKINFNIKN